MTSRCRERLACEIICVQIPHPDVFALANDLITVDFSLLSTLNEQPSTFPALTLHKRQSGSDTLNSGSATCLLQLFNL